MKQLILVRHAKSSWADVSVDDFNRKLNDRGKQDAPEMAEWLHKKIKHIDLFLSSPAKRAKKTCKIFCEEFKANFENIRFIESLYLASYTEIGEAISEVNENFSTVALFGHNPGITDFANSLVSNCFIDNMPTCSIFAVKCEVKYWKEFIDAKKEFLFFKSPRQK